MGENKGGGRLAVFTSEQITRKKPARFQTGTGVNALGSAGAPPLNVEAAIRLSKRRTIEALLASS
jgi:hypothetical protein